MGIQNLTQSDISASAQVPFYDVANGADRRTSVTQFAEVLQGLLSVSELQSQYYAPSATGWSVTVAPSTVGESVYLLITPVAGYAAGTITLPASSSLAHGQEIVVACTQSVTTLTVSGNGATVNGAPSTLAANGYFRLRYDGVLGTWNRIG
jgi:hypothetical protein